MTQRVQAGGLSIDALLHDFVRDEVLPGTDLEPTDFWSEAEAIISDFAPRNRDLLTQRDTLQSQIDAWHLEHPGLHLDLDAYKSFLRNIGYLADEPADFQISTENVDDELARLAGPQLVVPILNARFATNAANARWGSLYDALYGTDAIDTTGELAPGATYNESRGRAVVARGRQLLDEHWPLDDGSHADASAYKVDDSGLAVDLGNLEPARLANPGQFVGYQGERSAPRAIVIVHHGLHLELVINKADRIGASDPAGVSDLVLESALTSIMDLEDSVAAVDAEDKVVGYRNWLRLMQRTLTETVTKNGKTFERSLNHDRAYTDLRGNPVALRGRALMFIRNVGHLMTTDAVLDQEGREVPEGILDALVTTLCSMHDLRGPLSGGNSRTGSMYVVKPKMHGPVEVAFTVDLFSRVERALHLPRNTIKIGIMDEERRTTVNLKACIHAARERIAFINTGFLDRTGDEIHTSMLAGPFVRKADLKGQVFINAYEDFNVDTGLAAGFRGRAQIGKGMWAKPDLMSDMIEQKIAHPRAGATAAWVPSPTAATLHAMHYHQVDVFAEQDRIIKREPVGIDPILQVPVASDASWTEEEKNAEIDNNVQSILGYVVRWIDQGIGCSKVPDIDDIALMEDRATLRISSQLLANWLEHQVITEEAVDESLRRVSFVVDRQNAGDPLYRPLIGEEGPTLAYDAARDLIVLGAKQPSGYTEPILHRVRREQKRSVDRGSAPVR